MFAEFVLVVLVSKLVVWARGQDLGRYGPYPVSQLHTLRDTSNLALAAAAAVPAAERALQSATPLRRALAARLAQPKALSAHKTG
jgi:hypothetical protein